jgi:phosphatidylinositol alpha-mannosyltransferase
MARKVIDAAPASTAVIGTFHILPQGWLVETSTRLLGRYLRKNLRRFDEVFAVSSSAARFAERAFALQDVAVLPNVVDVHRFRSAMPLPKYANSSSQDTTTIMFLGRLVSRKGCLDLLKALRILHEQSPEMGFRVVVCGKGPQKDELQQLTKDFGLADMVEFTGFISEEDKPRYIAAADIIVFPSTGGESFGIVLIEGMASGRPVVLAASNPGYATVMEPRPEQMFAPGDVTRLAELLQLYQEDKAVRHESLVWQRAYVDRFDIDAVCKKLEAAYATQVTRRRRLQK